MASKSPINIVHPKDLDEPPGRGKVLQSSLGLDDRVKRHVVVGIVLNLVLVPELKKYIDRTLKSKFKDLCKRFPSIQTQEGLLEPKKYGFIVKTVPKISNHNDMAKLFLMNYMTKFKEILDDKFDASAALTILGSGKKFFSDLMRQNANSLRSNGCVEMV